MIATISHHFPPLQSGLGGKEFGEQYLSRVDLLAGERIVVCTHFGGLCVSICR